MQKLVLTAIVALAMAAPTAMAIDLDTTQVTSKWLVGFYDLTLKPGDLYMGERVLSTDTDLNFALIETANPDAVRVKTLLDSNVRYFEPDASDHHLYLTPNDPKYSDAGMYGVKNTNINLAWDTTLGSTAVKVFMIDSGVKATHEDLAGPRLLAGWNYNANNADVSDSSYCSNHGSHTTGTAGATTNNGKGIAGVSQHTIYPAKIFKGSNPGPSGCATTTTAIVNALKAAGDQGAAVSSNSWGGGSYSQAINDAITYSVNLGVTVVAAAGNSGGCTNCVGEPWKSATATVIVVACSDANNAFCSFSSQGPQVDVIAPGYNILSVDGAGTTGYKLLSGTSMSTPHVAGLAALVKALNPSFTPAQVEARIKSTATNLGMISDRQGAGLINGQAAVY